MGGEALGPALAGQSGLLPGQGAPLWRLVSVLFLRLLAWSPVAQTSVRGDILVDDKPFQLLDGKNYLAATWQVRLKTSAPSAPMAIHFHFHYCMRMRSRSTWCSTPRTTATCPRPAPSASETGPLGGRDGCLF